jgi:hypothetical protein
MLKAVGFAAKHSFSNLKRFEFERTPAKANEVELEILLRRVTLPLGRPGAPQPLGDDLHHLQRETRRLFDQPQKALFIDDGNSTIRAGDRRCAAGLAVDQRHFAEYPSRPYSFDHPAAQFDVDASFHHPEHAIRRIARLEYRRALSEVKNVDFTQKEVEMRHEPLRP